MTKLNETQIKLLSFLSSIEFTDLIHLTISHSTDSRYLMLAAADGTVYQVSFSNHYSHIHSKEVYDLDFDEVDFDETELEEDLTEAFELNMFSEMPEFYGIEKATTYNEDEVAQLAGKDSFDRAFATTKFNMQKVELINNNQVLTVTYDDGQTEFYINYLPTAASKEDTVLARYLGSDKRHDFDNFEIKTVEEANKEFEDGFDFRDAENFVEIVGNYVIFEF